VIVMSSSSTARVSSRAERRTTNDNGSAQPRAPSGQTGSRGERLDSRRTQSPQPATTGTSHKRTASGSQRTNRGLEERRTERVQVLTRETLTTSTRNPDRRSAPSAQPTERQRPAEPSRAYIGDPRPKASKPEALLQRKSRVSENLYFF
jgi:gamma-tubulin complex component 2